MPAIEPAIPTSPPTALPIQSRSSLSRAIPIIKTVGVSFGIVALQLVQGILSARLLGPEGRGEYAAALIYAQSILYVGLFGAIEIVCRYAGNDQIDRQSLNRSAWQLALVTGGATSLIAVALNCVALPPDNRHVLPLAIICSLAIFGQQITLILSAVARGSNDFKRYNRWRLWAAAVFPVLLLGWMLVGTTTVTSVSITWLIASLLSALPCFIKGGETVGQTVAPGFLRMLREGRPYALATLATDLLERLDLLLMLWLTSYIVMGNVTLGYYNSMIPVAYPLTVIPNTFGLYLFNAGAKKGSALTVSRVHQLLAICVGIQIFMTIGFIATVGPVVRIVYGEEFMPAVVFAIWLAPVSAIKGIVQGLENYVKGRGRPLAAVSIRIGAAIVMLISIGILYSRSGILSIVQGSLIGQIFCLIGVVWLVYSESD